MRNATLCVIITTALQRPDIQTILYSTVPAGGGSIFANSKICKDLIYTVYFSLNSYILSLHYTRSEAGKS